MKKVDGGRLFELFLVENLIEDDQKVIVEAPKFPADKYYFKINRFGKECVLYDVISDQETDKKLSLNDIFHCNFKVQINEEERRSKNGIN